MISCFVKNPAPAPMWCRGPFRGSEPYNQKGDLLMEQDNPTADVIEVVTKIAGFLIGLCFFVLGMIINMLMGQKD